MKKNVTARLFVLLSFLFVTIGISGRLPDTYAADSAVAQSTGKNTIEYKTVFPGVYDKDEQELVDATKAFFSGDSKQLAEKLKAQVVAKKKQTAKLGGKDVTLDMELNSGNPLVSATIGDNDLLAKAYVLNPRNPLYTDRAYSIKAKGGFIAAPFTVDIGPAFPYVPKGTDIWVANDDPTTLRGLDHEITFYKPIMAGDTLQGVLTKQTFEDISDAKGSTMRKLRAIGETELYNQKGEKVMSGVYRGVETYKIFKDRSMAASYDKPLTIYWAKYVDWEKIRPIHQYTDADWAKIKELWSKESIRGSKTLYWQDVKIGDEPAWTVDGPITEEDRWNGGGVIRLQKPNSVRDALTAAASNDSSMGSGKVETYKDDYGIYHVKTSTTGGQPGGGAPGGAQNKNARSTFMNTAGRDYATKFITNWMGDDGWLYKMSWRLAFCWDAGKNMFPANSDRPSYLLKVPYLKEKGKFMNSHGFVGDTAITKGYVCDKYIKDSKHYVDVVVWCEDIEGNIWAECYAVVELTSNSCS
jgi:hypothetical protein